MMIRLSVLLALALMGAGCASAADTEDDATRSDTETAASAGDTGETGSIGQGLSRYGVGETSTCSDDWTKCRSYCGALDTTCLNNCQTTYSNCKCGMDHCPPGSLFVGTVSTFGSGTFQAVAQ
jgi:hypothetical protein